MSAEGIQAEYKAKALKRDALRARANTLATQISVFAAGRTKALIDSRDADAASASKEIGSREELRVALEAAVTQLESDMSGLATRINEANILEERRAAGEGLRDATSEMQAARAALVAHVESSGKEFQRLLRELRQAHVAGDVAQKRLNAATGASQNWDSALFDSHMPGVAGFVNVADALDRWSRRDDPILPTFSVTAMSRGQ